MVLKADSLQAALFLAPGQPQTDALNIWDRLFPGESPDSFQRASATPNLQSIASGERGSYLVTISVQVSRIDIHAFPPGIGIPSPLGPRRIEDVGSLVDYVKLHVKNLSRDFRVIRAAMVLDLAKTVAKGQETSELQILLPSLYIIEGATEVMLQFNKKRRFVCAPDLEMNRLYNWSSGQIGYLQNVIGQPVNLLFSNPTSYIGYKIDINSSAEILAPQEKINGMIDEIAAECLSSMEIPPK